MNRSHVVKVFKTTLAIGAIVSSAATFNVDAAQADLDSQAIDRVNSLNLKVKTKPTTSRSTNTNLIADNDRALSVEYQEIGMKYQKEGNNELALKNYYIALKFNDENAHAWLLVGTIFGNTDTGIKAIKLAAQLFKLQEDEDCYKIAMDLLEKFDAND
jgi:tetratricopeptide (TPR) repeat protein